MRLKRKPGWQERLTALVAEREHLPFAPGVNDCVLFAADCVLAVTGVDLVPEGVRGAYSDEKGMLRMQQQVGPLRDLAAERLGAVVSPLLAQVGDVAAVAFNGREALAVCLGQFFLAPGAVGLVQIPRTEALVVWRCMREE
jgi:hypothetical protein